MVELTDLESDFWTRIRDNASKVLDLDIHVFESITYHYVLRLKTSSDEIILLLTDSTEAQKCYPLMLIVNAIEKDQKGLFTRIPHEVKKNTIEYGWIFWKKNSGGVPTVRTTSPQDYLALLECVALTLETFSFSPKTLPIG